MIRVELESDRSRLPAILAVVGVCAIVVALYGLDQQIGLLRLVRGDFYPVVGSTTPAADRSRAAFTDLHRTPPPGSGRVEAPDDETAAAQVSRAGDVAAAVPGMTAPVGGSRQEISRQEMTADETAVSGQLMPVTWWRTPFAARRLLPETVTVTDQTGSADGVFQIKGYTAPGNHEALAHSVRQLRDRGYAAYVTFWREADAPRSAFIVQGAGGSDAPSRPPTQATMDVEALLHLAQVHARSAGLSRLARYRPTHESWAAGGTRIEQAISGVGTAAQIETFAAALASETRARLTRFHTETSETGLMRVTASLDVLLRKESDR